MHFTRVAVDELFETLVWQLPVVDLIKLAFEVDSWVGMQVMPEEREFSELPHDELDLCVICIREVLSYQVKSCKPVRVQTFRQMIDLLLLGHLVSPSCPQLGHTSMYVGVPNESFTGFRFSSVR